MEIRYFTLNEQKFCAMMMTDKALLSIIIKRLKRGWVRNTYYSAWEWA